MARRTEPSDRELTEELGKLIPCVRRLMWNAATQRLEGRRLSMFAVQLVGRVMREGGLSQLELARLTAQHPAGVCRTLEELESQGLVRRERDRRDRRRVLVRATRRGRTLYTRSLPEMLGAVEGTLAPLSRAERETLRNLLRKVEAGSRDAG